uniref:Uncharacterized protein n=1 Tax=Neogobius melanostomus TaxID=47308 RepID=A0A8C6WEA0_9GOBI
MRGETFGDLNYQVQKMTQVPSLKMDNSCTTENLHRHDYIFSFWILCIVFTELFDVTPSPNVTQSGTFISQISKNECLPLNIMLYDFTSDVAASVLPWTPSEHNSNQNTGLPQLNLSAVFVFIEFLIQLDMIFCLFLIYDIDFFCLALNLVYIIIPTIPLILLFLTVMGVCCFKIVGRRRTQQKSEVCQTEPGLCPSPASTNVYNVIQAQKEDDLGSTRPHTKNTSFLGSSPDTPTGDYDNLGGRDTESGFVTLASTESCFLNFDLNDLSLGRRGNLYDTSLGRPAKRDIGLNGSSLGRPTGHREFYDRSLGRRTTKSEHYSSGVYVDPDMYDTSLFDPKLRPPIVKADLYQTYVNSGKEDIFQSRLGAYGQRKSYQANVDYRSGLNLDNGRRYLDWINRENY